MIKHIICLILLFCSFDCSTYAQDGTNTTNLFEYGRSVTSGEDNLKNLFSNFPKYINNAGIVELLSYQYIGVAKNQKEARRYIEQNVKTPAIGTIRGFGAVCSTITLCIDKTVTSDDLKDRVETLSRYVHKDSEVYQINCVVNMKATVYYVFVNPQDKRVVTKGNMFGFSIPVEHLEKCDTKSLSIPN